MNFAFELGSLYRLQRPAKTRTRLETSLDQIAARNQADWMKRLLAQLS